MGKSIRGSQPLSLIFVCTTDTGSRLGYERNTGEQKTMTTSRTWIAFGDMHEHTANLAKINHLADADHILISGDLTNCGDRRKAEKILAAVRRINPHVLAQIGNMDTRDVDVYFSEQGINTHARGIDLGDGVKLMGVGYSLQTPFHTPSEVDEDTLHQWLTKAYEECGDYEHLVLMVHNPPLNTTTDKLGSGVSVGSSAIRKFIETVQPDVCVTGHIHEARSVDRIGKTTIINPGDFASGGYVRITLIDGRLDARLEMAGAVG